MRIPGLVLLGALSPLFGCNAGPIVQGDLVLESADDVSAARSVEEIEGSLIINGSSLLDLTGLESVEWIGGSLIIGGELGNASLSNVEGLSGLQRVERDITIRRNTQLTDLGGLRGLATVGGSFVITENNAMTTLGMTSLTRIDSFFTIDSNYALSSMTGMEALEWIDFTLAIDSNSALGNLRGLAGLRSVGRMYIRYNLLLPSCAATGLRDQVETYGGFTRYDMAVEILQNNDDGSCEAGPLG